MTTMTAETQSTDRIEKHFEVRAPLAKVWRAVSDSRQFSTWFGINLTDPFVAGKTTRGNITAKGYEHFKVEFMVEKIEAERYFSYRWHPYPSDPNVDYSQEPTTLVEFTLEEVQGGTAVTIVESGFDRIPLARRAEAFRMNDGGWTGQVKNLTKYVA
ncbi:MAG TPA: SRPBCC family protein [Gemmatimonadales bacterium]|nr:SRPBCC family protein [Gemmatimonadales bacterium]